jgi:aminoglycoside phosphotransferase (APT) family kinase protein
VPQTLRALEQRFGALVPLGGGYSSKVFAAGDKVLKVYHAKNGSHEVEAAHMRRAGLGEWVLETLELEPSHEAGVPAEERVLTEAADVLVMRRFPGHAVQPTEIRAALPALGAFLRQLHAQHGVTVNLEALRSKVVRFDAGLSQRAFRPLLEPLFRVVRDHLEVGTLAVPSSLCHLDLWQQNVLFDPPDRVLVVDWHKSGFDDAVRDYALFFTGTLELLPIEDAKRLILDLTDAEGVTERLAPYIALSTLHDLYWFQHKQPQNLETMLRLKLPRTLEML